MGFQSKLLFSAVFLFAANASTQGSDVFDKFRTLIDAKQNEAAVKLFEEALPKTSSTSEKALMQFALGKLYYDQGKDEDAQKHFSEATTLGSSLQDQTQYYLGKSCVRTDKDEAAKLAFLKIVQKKQRSYLYVPAEFELGKILLKEKKYPQAWKYLIYAEKKLRGAEEYAEVLWNLAKLDFANKQTARACKWVKKLYTKNSDSVFTKDWNLDLAKNEIEGRKTGCFANFSDQKKRIRNLQLTGQSNEAKHELDELEKATKEKSFSLDQLKATYLLQEGDAFEAFKILIPYYPYYQSNYDYLLVLGNAATRAGEFQAAVGAYYRAHKLRKKSKSGRYALFQSAFLSYQFQDYDGATRKFNEFLKVYPGSGLSKDTSWHLAWIRYLKKDYVGAAEDFKKLSKIRSLRNQDRVIYWTAMTYIHLNDYAKAQSLLRSLVFANSPTYYSLAAKARLDQISSELKLRNLAQTNSTAGELSPEGTPVAEISTESNESEENVSAIDEVAESEDEAKDAGDDVAGKDVEEPSTEGVLSSGTTSISAVPVKRGDKQTIIAPKEDFDSIYANQVFARAGDLSRLGFYDLARWELFEVEKRSRKSLALQKLISEYEKIHSYNRSSHIASNNFVRERTKFGFSGAKNLWQSAFPQAYPKDVDTNSKATGVEKEFIWSIMRAESSYRSDARSPVGALGLMQLMPYTADKVAIILGLENFEAKSLKDPGVNIRLGSSYLKRLLGKFDNKIALAAAAYNAGPHRVKMWIKNFGNLDMDEFIEHIPYVETRNYVKRVTQNYFIYNQIYNSPNTAKEKGLDVKAYVAWLSQPINIQLQGEVSTKEDWN